MRETSVIEDFVPLILFLKTTNTRHAEAHVH